VLPPDDERFWRIPASQWESLDAEGFDDYCWLGLNSSKCEEKKINFMPDSDNKPSGFVKFHHKRSGLFRVVHADGAWGNVNQTGTINLTLYSEHLSIPYSVAYPLNPNGNIINTPTFEADEGLQR
jgi:hypothetical protein